MEIQANAATIQSLSLQRLMHRSTCRTASYAVPFHFKSPQTCSIVADIYNTHSLMQYAPDTISAFKYKPERSLCKML